MAVNRKIVGHEKYQGRELVARYLGPDLLAYVDNVELSGFYLDSKGAMLAGRKHVDAEIKAEKERGR